MQSNEEFWSDFNFCMILYMPQYHDDTYDKHQLDDRGRHAPTGQSQHIKRRGLWGNLGSPNYKYKCLKYLSKIRHTIHQFNQNLPSYLNPAVPV